MSKAQSEELNGLHPAKIKEIVESLKNPEVLKAVSGPWRARVQWQGGFRAKAYMRTHTVELDEPAGLDATDLAASAHEYILSAVGGCMMVGFVLNATKKGNPGYPAINAKVFVKADADEKTLREIWKLAVDGSPVTQTVARETKIITEFEAV
jgi:uncharacterized OsmC-like protein